MTELAKRLPVLYVPGIILTGLGVLLIVAVLNGWGSFGDSSASSSVLSVRAVA